MGDASLCTPATCLCAIVLPSCATICWSATGATHHILCLASDRFFVFLDVMVTSLHTPESFRAALERRGATRLRRVTFRRNRSTVWSLTQRGTALNLHVAYRQAPTNVLDAFAVIVRTGGVANAASRAASRLVLEWPELTHALEAARSSGYQQGSTALAKCSGTDEQRDYVRALYRYFNRTRFDGILPEDVPLRLSHRMRSALGHMMPGEHPDGRRYVAEIALNIDLLLSGNGAERVDTLLHEMAHAADYLTSGERGHGSSWRRWARHVGCRPSTLYHRPVRRRRTRRTKVTRVPPLPPALRGLETIT